MKRAITITSVVLSGRRRSLPDLVDGHREIWFDIRLTVENPEDRPLHVINELREIAYDETRRTLTLKLAEPPPGAPDKNAPTFHLPAPRTVMVEGGGSATITVPIPAELKTMRQGKGMGLEIEKTDLRQMQTIRCEISSDEHPIASHPTETPYDLRKRLANWGSVVTLDTPVKPDARGSEPNPKFHKKRAKH